MYKKINKLVCVILAIAMIFTIAGVSKRIFQEIEKENKAGK